MDAGMLNLTFNLPVFGGSGIKPAALAFQSSDNDNTFSSALTACSMSVRTCCPLRLFSP
jgi:hypothetical protein